MQEQYMRNDKKIVITGASGFLGSHLLENLIQIRGYRIFALSSKPNELKTLMGGQEVEYMFKDAINGESERDIFEGAIVINCAYPRNYIGEEIANGLKYIQEVFESAVRNRAEAIINISSQSVYSQQRTEMATEDTPVCLENTYAVGKYAVELLLESICNGTETHYTNLRMASLIGPGFNQRIVNRLVIKIMQHEKITIVRQEKRMGFLDIDDAVEAIVSMLKMPDKSWKSIYNVGNAKGYTVESIYKSIASILSGEIKSNNLIIENGSDISTTEVSFERLHNDTGFTPKVTLDESIKKIISKI